MAERSGNKNIKIVAATAMTIFSLFSVFSASYAWFMAIRNSKSLTDGFDVKVVSGYFNKMTIHNSVSVSNSLIQFDSTPEITVTVTNRNTGATTETHRDEENPVFPMGTYDYLEKSHPVLMLIKIGEETNANGCSVTASSVLHVDAHATTSYFVGDMAAGRVIYDQESIDPSNGHINPLSSVVSYKSTYYGSDTEFNGIYHESGYTHDNVTYNTYDITTASLTNTVGSFTEFNQDDTYKTYKKDRVVFTTEKFNYDESVKSYNVRYVAVVFDYYEAAVEAIYSAFIGSPALDNQLLFNCDWTMEI
ncbi:MAG: hypothetical protein K6C32_05380 [Bacilli bacterium]|nr:hypothetical protein [Bacilli bacterium]